jgi:hypothetical protein
MFFVIIAKCSIAGYAKQNSSIQVTLRQRNNEQLRAAAGRGREKTKESITAVGINPLFVGELSFSANKE